MNRESRKWRSAVLRCTSEEPRASRKVAKPKDNTVDVAAAIGVELLTEERYRELRKLGEFDPKTSSWVKTPPRIRKVGGALFCDRRFDTVLVYQEPYCAARGPGCRATRSAFEAAAGIGAVHE